MGAIYFDIYFNITGQGWGSPAAGSLKWNVTGGYFTSFVDIVAMPGVGSTHPGTQYSITKASDSSLTEIHLNGTSGASTASSLNVEIFLFGE